MKVAASGLRASGEASRSRGTRRLAFLFVASTALSLMLVMATGFAAFGAAAVGQSDFAYVWSGPRTLLDGGDPYEATSWALSTSRLGTTLAGTPAIYSYPPYVAVALLPLGALPLLPAYVVWTWVGLALALVVMWRLVRQFSADAPEMFVLAPSILILSLPALQSFYGGQWSLLIVAAGGALMLALDDRSFMRTVASAAVLLAKPQIGALFLAGLTWRCLRRGEHRLVLALTSAVVLVFLPSALLAGRWLVSWLTEVPRARVAEAGLSTLSSLVGPWVAAVLLILALAAALAVDVRSRVSGAPWLALGVLAAPYAHPYDALVLVVAIVVTSFARRVIALVAAVVLLVVPWLVFFLVPHASGYESAAVIAPLVIYCILTLGVAVAWRPANTQ